MRKHNKRPAAWSAGFPAMLDGIPLNQAALRGTRFRETEALFGYPPRRDQ